MKTQVETDDSPIELIIRKHFQNFSQKEKDKEEIPS